MITSPLQGPVRVSSKKLLTSGKPGHYGAEGASGKPASLVGKDKGLEEGGKVKNVKKLKKRTKKGEGMTRALGADPWPETEYEIQVLSEQVSMYVFCACICVFMNIYCACIISVYVCTFVWM
jgi:hypothetical protein